MFYIDVALAIGLGLLLTWQRPLIIPAKLRALRIPPYVAPLCALVLAGLFALELRAIALQAATPRSAGLPFLPIDDAAAVTPAVEQFAAVLLALSLVQSAALGLLFLALAEPATRFARIVLYACGAMMAAIAVTSPAVTSGDIYSYVGYALLGASAYAPPHAPFGDGFAAIGRWWGTPLVPMPYGPAFLVYDRLITGLGAGLVAKVLLLRWGGLIWLALLAACLRRLGASTAALVVLVLNPFMLLQFVTNAHVDIIAVTLVTAAVLLVVRRPVYAVALTVLAALFKLPFVLVGMLAFSKGRPPQNVLLSVTAFALTLGLSLLFGGRAYERALLNHALTRAGFESSWHLLVAAAGFAAIVAAVGWKWRNPILAYALPNLTPGLFPWYQAWAIPYLAENRAWLASSFIALPVVGFLAESVTDTAPALKAVGILLLLATGGAALRLARQRYFHKPQGLLGDTAASATAR